MWAGGYYHYLLYALVLYKTRNFYVSFSESKVLLVYRSYNEHRSFVATEIYTTNWFYKCTKSCASQLPLFATRTHFFSLCSNKSMRKQSSETSGDWEEHLQLLPLFYRTARHSLTGLLPYEVLFGTNPPSLHLPIIHTSVIPDPSAYSVCLQ